MSRVIFFIDGFNLYHAVKALGENHLKWMDLRKLCLNFAPAPQYSIENIYYFSAHATWLPAPFKMHQLFIEALKSQVLPLSWEISKKKTVDVRNAGVHGKLTKKKKRT